MELFDAIKARRSVRKFKDTPVPDEVVREMLEAASLAPSPGNAQGYVFGVIKDRALKMQLAEAAGNQMWIATAPIVFACCGDISWDIAEQPESDFGLIVNRLRFGMDLVNFMIGYPDRRACMKLFNNGAPSIPAEHMFLTAVSHGMSACYIGYLDVDKASKILNLPRHLLCLYLLPVGYADEIPCQKHIKGIDEISFYDKWKE